MKQISKIQTSQGSIELEELWSNYLFSYFYLFFITKKLHFYEKKAIVIQNDIINELNETLMRALGELLETSYVEPTINELQKHSTRFELILLNNKKYKINYRLTEAGRMAYAIYNITKLVNKAIVEKSDVCVYIT